jgi:release factor glutamine methyltransferase
LEDASRRLAYDVISALLDVPRFWPSTHVDEPASDSLREEAFIALARLKQGAPFAYAVRRATFRHLTLEVDERVLIPRPETELLVEEVLRLAPHRIMAADNGGRWVGATPTWGVAIDIGTGSGAIALALASEGNFSHVIGTDLSSEALAVARRNASSAAGGLKASVEFRHGSLLEPVRDVRAAVIVSNPPYIAFGETQQLPASVRDWEPAMALLSGDNGMAATADIVRDAAQLLEPGGVLAIEADCRRASLVAELLLVDPRYEDIAVRLDLTGRERFVVARRRDI